MNRIKIMFLVAVVVAASLSEIFAQNSNTRTRRNTRRARIAATTNNMAANQQKIVLSPLPDFTAVEAPSLDSAGYNTLSVKPIHKSDIMYQMTVWRKLDLKEKANTPLFAQSQEITKFIVEAVRKGELKAYRDDSLNKEMSLNYFESRIEDKEATLSYGAMNNSVNNGNSRIFLNANKLHLLEVKENIIFDKQRSRRYYDVQAITMILPAKYSGDKGAEIPIASFKYKDLVHLLDKNPQAMWYNTANAAEAKRFSDAFDLRLFSSRIIKVANPKDELIEDSYPNNTKAALIGGANVEYELMVAKESELWEY